MSKHTPGPWTQGNSKNGKECVWLNGKTEPPLGQGMGLDYTWIDCGTEANARLIAAAPDLLAALKSIAIAMEDEVLVHDDQREAMRAATAAIAKATGGAA